KIFLKITNLNTREKIKTVILSLDIIIPSLATMHRNLLYISLSVFILKRHVINDMPKEKEKKALESDKAKQGKRSLLLTIYKRLRKN
ncbi:hypothetical protein QBC33DRAFT_458296, partial [Phialemonium atrogriseum]